MALGLAGAVPVRLRAIRMDPEQWTIRPEDDASGGLLRPAAEIAMMSSWAHCTPWIPHIPSWVRELAPPSACGSRRSCSQVTLCGASPVINFLEMSDRNHIFLADEECGQWHERTGATKKRWVYGISGGLAACAVATVLVLKFSSPSVATSDELFAAHPMITSCPDGHFHQCPSDWKDPSNDGGYHCLHKLARQTSEKAYESSGGACRPAKDGPFPYDDCQDQCGIGATVTKVHHDHDASHVTVVHHHHYYSGNGHGYSHHYSGSYGHGYSHDYSGAYA
eukprot:Skav229092  [mRNA]  locus=scaffold92:120048:142997:- [translate_table: standard]